MNKDDIAKLSKPQIGQIAAAYMLMNPGEAPDEVKKMVEKLASLDRSIMEIMRTMKEARNTITQLQPKADQVLGSIDTLTELISDSLSEEKKIEFAEKYDMSKAPSPGQGLSKPAAATPPDIAGATAKQYNEENPIPSGG